MGRSREMLEVFYCDRQYRLYVTDRGFTLWDDRKKLWIIDASCIEDGDNFQVTDDVKQIKNKHEGNLEFEPFRREPKKRKPKSPRRRKA